MFLRRRRNALFKQPTAKMCSKIHSKNKSMKRVLMLGPTNVGKSSLIERFTKNCFIHDRPSTIGVGFDHTSFEVPGLGNAQFQLVDTAGISSLQIELEITKPENADAIVIVFDVTQIMTLSEIVSLLEDIKRRKRAEVPVFLVGNKNDRHAGARSVRDVDTNLLYIKFELSGVYFTSAKTGANVLELFRAIATTIKEFADDTVEQLEIETCQQPSPKPKRKLFCCM